MIFLTLCLLLGLTTLNAKSVSTFYDAIAKNCANLDVSDTSFKNQIVFQKCKSWMDIDKTNILNKETEENVLCLLYYESFTSFCKELKVSKLSNITVNIVPDLKDIQVNTICKNLSSILANKKLEHNITKTISEATCYRLCEDYDNTPVIQCSLAYYFANYNISQFVPVVPNTKTVETKSNEVKTETSEKELKHPSIANLNNEQSNDETVKSNHESEKIQKEDKPASEKQSSPKTTPNPKPDPVLPLDSIPKNKNVPNTASTNVNENSQPNAPTKPNSTVTETAEVTAPRKEAQKPSPDKTVFVEGILQNQPEDIPLEDKQLQDDNKDAVDLPADQQSSMDQPEQQLPDEPIDDEESNEANYKDDDEKLGNGDDAAVISETKKEKPNTLTLSGDLPGNYNTVEDLDGESYFFSYFMVICVLFVLGYVGYHNRQKVMALMLEGKRGKRQVRSRRPNSANYHKLDSNLEEAISSTCTKNSSHVIY